MLCIYMVYTCICKRRFAYTCIYHECICMPIGMSTCYVYRCIYHVYRCISMFLVRWSGFQMLPAGVGRPVRAPPPHPRRRRHGRRRHGPSAGLPGHLDSLGPDSEVLARVLASTSRLHAGSFEVASRTGSDARLQPVENHLQAATGH